MPASGHEALHALTAFTDLFEAFDQEAIQYAVIGGCAVGVYARIRGERVLSADLDLYAAPSTLSLLLSRAPSLGLELRKGLEARALPVAVFEWRGMEVNVLTSSTGLPEPEAVIRDAREIQLDQKGVLLVPVASRLLTTLGVQTLPEGLARRLIPLADSPSLRRFMASRIPTAAALASLLARAPESEHPELGALAKLGG